MKMRLFRPAALVFASLSFFAFPFLDFPAGAGSCAVYGTVMDQQGQGIKTAIVRLRSGTLSYKEKSGAGGSYCFRELKKAAYTASVLKTGYKDAGGTVKYKGKPVKRDFTLQAGMETPVLSVSPVKRDVGYAATQATFDVANLGKGELVWSASVVNGGDWMSISSGSGGSGNGTITVSFSLNSGSAKRSGTVRVAAEGAKNSPRYAAVSQEGKGGGSNNGDGIAPTTTASPPEGKYTSAQTVTLACADNAGGSGCAATRYTTDGSDPDTSSYVYTSPIPISSTTTLKFFSVDKAENAEPVKTRTYTISTVSATKPNLAPYTPSGWSDTIVVSTTTGTTTDSGSFTTSDTIYVDWAVINNGTADINTTVHTYLYVDGVYKYDGYFSTMNSNKGVIWTDISLGTLSAGSHTIKIAVDATGVVAESNESDNEYSKTITVTASSGGKTVTDIDGNVYNTVVIGAQTWMKENLKVTKYRDGAAIPTTTPATLDISAETSPAYQWAYNGDEANVSTYGRLYTWHAATDSRGLCPSGWHLPTDAEWTTLTDYLGGGNAGGKMKEAGTTHWNSPNTSADDSSGFTALPGGYRYNYGTFSLAGSYGYWWSATEYSSTSAWYRNLYYDYGDVSRDDYYKGGGFSVRCVGD